MDLTQLNPMQLEAVLTQKGPLLILAGAGSGKTRTVTYRIAKLIEDGVSPYGILALTFTNKAAREMAERVEELVGDQGVWVSTFHSACVRILRQHIERIGYSKTFTIYDDSDQLALVGICLEELHIDDESLTKRKALSLISEAKNRSQEPEKYLKERAAVQQGICGIEEIYAQYQQRLKNNNALDFDDLLLLTIRLFEECPEVLDIYRRRFEYIHVDEYQDTNIAQYELVKMLSSLHGNICVVGDDDQGIYSWRGADIRNILEFEKDFPNTKVVRLEQNYRSTGYILDAANALISRNQSRKEKALFTDRGKGEKIVCHTAFDQHEEARFICETIEKECANGFSYADCAVLYRLNSQSRVLEEMLRYYNIPYKVYGGVGFYQRKEVKDLIAYLRVLNNPADDVSLLRIINTPKRGIGDAAVAAIEQAARSRMVPMFGVVLNAQEMLENSRSKAKVLAFGEIIRLLLAQKSTLELSDFVQKVIETTGYAEQYEKMNNEEGRARLENIQEFLGAVYEFEQSGLGGLAEFLESVALVSDIDGLEEDAGAISLMTMHSAKGLEFPMVVVAGLEEGIFPHARSFLHQESLEEERRLCYVAITRAKRRLYMCNCLQRTLFGKTTAGLPSRFLSELPKDCVILSGKKRMRVQQVDSYADPMRDSGGSSFVKPRVSYTPAQIKPKENAEEFVVGTRVRHKKFGDGKIVSLSGQGAGKTICVCFDGHGEKKLSLSFAPVEII
ncbi:MAG: ATP-dependent helicase [Christensenellales bacterium]